MEELTQAELRARAEAINVKIAKMKQMADNISASGRAQAVEMDVATARASMILSLGPQGAMILFLQDQRKALDETEQAVDLMLKFMEMVERGEGTEVSLEELEQEPEKNVLFSKSSIFPSESEENPLYCQAPSTLQ